MNRADNQDLSQLADAAEQVVQAVQEGSDPTEAAVKVAGQNEFSNNWTSRMCELSNRLFAMSQIESSDSEKRAGDYPVIDPEAVTEQMFPSVVVPAKAASAVQHNMGQTIGYEPPPMTKAAHAGQPAAKKAKIVSEEDLLQRAFQSREELQDIVKNASRKRQHVAHEVGLSAKAAALAIAESQVLFSDVEERARWMYGQAGTVAMTAVHGFMPKAARFDGTPREFTTNPWGQTPYTAVFNVVKTVKRASMQLTACETEEKLAARFVEVIGTHLRGIAKTQGGQEKDAAGIGPYLIMKEMLSTANKPTESQTPEELLAGGVTEEDAELSNRLRSSQALAAALSDEVISQYPLPQVIQSYNRLTAMLPRSTNYSAVLVPNMRQMLETPDRSPMDIEQTQKVEQRLADKDAPALIA